MSAVASPSGAPTPGPSLKRRHDSSSDDDVCAKQQRYFYVLASESDCSSEGPESVYSVQAKSTDVAKDTSDTSSKDSWSGYEDRPMFELEVVSLSESDRAFPFPEATSSSPEDMGRMPSPVEAADTVSSRRSAEGSDDEGESRLRFSGLFPFCRQCKGFNTDPHFMYCIRCHRKRKSFLPERPKGKRGKSKSRRMVNRNGALSRWDSKGETSMDKEISQKLKREKEEEEAAHDSGVFSQSSAGTIPPDGPETGAANLCQICMTNPRDGGFCHDNIVHVYSCYRCSLKTYRGRGRCPVCNRIPKQVSKIITV